MIHVDFERFLNIILLIIAFGCCRIVVGYRLLPVS